MIQQLNLQDVGPVRSIEFDFAPRINVLTGDNGLGKTFVLDVLWWVLTTTWAGEKAFPWRPPTYLEGFEPRQADKIQPSIGAALEKRELPQNGMTVQGKWDWENQEWDIDNQRVETNQSLRSRSLVLYARTDGSYAIWDPYDVKPDAKGFADSAIVLRNQEVWDGKEVTNPDGKRTVIGGLIADWVKWQLRAKSSEFEALRRVLHALSSPDERLVPDEPTRVHKRDRREIPTLSTSYGTVPVTHASAGVRRIISLAYLLVWAFSEHKKAAELSQRKPIQDVVLLIDEPELHLHPTWQRVILPALMKAVGMIAPNVAVQLFTSTHSPIVLASLESVFREKLDDLFVLSREGSLVRAKELPFAKEGDVSNWLVSDVFGGVGGRSREATMLIDTAMHFMAKRYAEAETSLRAFLAMMNDLPLGELDWLTTIADESRPLVERIHEALKNTLPGHDEFWVQWTLVHRPSGGKRAAR
jgi:hypothetical protein